MENTILEKNHALDVIIACKKAVEKSPTKVSFVSIKGYTNKFGEEANHLINIGASYEKAKQKDIEFLRQLNVNSFESKLDKTLLEQARIELIDSFVAPQKSRSEGQINAYTNIVSGIKVHNETGEIYVYGYRERKEIIIEGTYPIVNSKALTIAKNELRKLLKTGKFTQYVLKNVSYIKANGETLEM
jgi:hypothetical protein